MSANDWPLLIPLPFEDVMNTVGADRPIHHATRIGMST
jgi:hypothetical protein